MPKSGDVHVAYQVFGEGSVDLVYVPGFISNIEHYWDEPTLARWLQRLARFARVISFDKRGTGLSDRANCGAGRTSNGRASHCPGCTTGRSALVSSERKGGNREKNRRASGG
jgi:pimeloyl-ACP methyl ester carboxylesterase